jgi:hypothetical protein
MDNRKLQMENLAFGGTAGVSRNNRTSGFTPAFLDKKTGLIEIAKLKNGQPSPMHIISWLPRKWASRLAADGTVECLKPGIIAGFVRDGVFYTREQTAEL